MTPDGEVEAATHSLALSLERGVAAPGVARAAVAEQLAAAGIDGSKEQTIVLLVSEVVSNAVRHSSAPAGAAIELRASVDDQLVRVSVTDAGEGFTPRPRNPDNIGDGYGLYLLEKAAASWGVEQESGTTVWFEIER